MRNLALFLGSISVSLALSACGGGDTPAATAPTVASAKPEGDPSLPKSPTKPDSDKCTWKKGAKTCHMNAKSDGDLSAAVAGIGKGCIDTTKMHALGATETGDSSTTVKTVPVKVSANHCYRVIGLAQASVTDFDIAVMASDGKSCGEDLNDSNDAIVLEDGVICFNQDDTVNVNAAVAAGTGKWAFQVWSD